VALKNYKPNTPGLRYRTSIRYDELDKKKSEKNLSKGKGFKAGRNSAGRISVRRKGGQHKRRYREVDFRRDKNGIPGKVAAIEYDPN
jgi:large subunit ribosomal protein L2